MKIKCSQALEALEQIKQTDTELLRTTVSYLSMIMKWVDKALSSTEPIVMETVLRNIRQSFSDTIKDIEVNKLK